MGAGIFICSFREEPISGGVCFSVKSGGRIFTAGGSGRERRRLLQLQGSWRREWNYLIIFFFFFGIMVAFIFISTIFTLIIIIIILIPCAILKIMIWSTGAGVSAEAGLADRDCGAQLGAWACPWRLGLAGLAEQSSGVLGNEEIGRVNPCVAVPAQVGLIWIAEHSCCRLAQFTFLHDLLKSWICPLSFLGFFFGQVAALLFIYTPRF